MTKASRLVHFVCAVAIILISSWSFAEEDQGNTNSINLVNFQAGPVVALEDSGFSSSLLLRYLPEYSWGIFAVGLDLGITSFSLKWAGDKIFAFEYGAQARYRFDPNWAARILVGAQSWSENGTAFFFGPEVQYHFTPNQVPTWLDHLYLSYTPIFQSIVVHEISAGIGIQF